MNRGALQSLPVQQMMPAGNPNRWNINTMKPPISHHHHHHHHHDQPLPFLAPPNNLYPQFVPNSNTPTSLNPSYNNHIPSWLDHNQDQLPESWSQLLLGGLVGDEDPKGNMMNHFQIKKLENWEEQILCNNSNNNNGSVVDHVKQEQAGNYVYGHGRDEFHHQAVTKPELANWSNNNNMMPNNSSCNSPKSCVTTFSSNMLDFSNKADHQALKNPPVSDRSFECNSSVTGGALKKARINQASSTQSTFKVRKEKLGDRITALHQLVSPFGKTDTASVLLEAIGYVRFLQSQIEALSLPYLGSGSGNMRQQQQQSLHGERNCMFPEDPGQLLNDNCMKRKGAPDQQGSGEEPKKDLRSRGLCLVPVSCTLQVGSDNGADYWAPAIGGGFR